MANFKNIEPYANMVHEAAVNGGPKQYLDMIAKKSFEQGVATTESKMTGYVVAALLIGGGIAAGVVKLIDFCKKQKEKAKEKAEEVEALKEEALQALEEEKAEASEADEEEQ